MQHQTTYKAQDTYRNNVSNSNKMNTSSAAYKIVCEQRVEPVTKSQLARRRVYAVAASSHRYQQPMIIHQATGERGKCSAHNNTSVARLIQMLKQEISALKKKLKDIDLLLVQKEIYAQSLLTDLNHAIEYISNMQVKNNTTK